MLCLLLLLPLGLFSVIQSCREGNPTLFCICIWGCGEGGDWHSDIWVQFHIVWDVQNKCARTLILKKTLCTEEIGLLLNIDKTKPAHHSGLQGTTILTRKITKSELITTLAAAAATSALTCSPWTPFTQWCRMTFYPGMSLQRWITYFSWYL